MTANATPQHLRSMEEVVADLTADLRRLGLSGPRRLKLAVWVEVLENEIANRTGESSASLMSQRP